MSFACWMVTTLAPTTTVGCFSPRYGSGFRCRVDALPDHANGGPNGKKKIVVVGSGWAGLGAAHHLCNQVCLCSLTHSFFLYSSVCFIFIGILSQGFDVTVLEGDDNGFGGLDDVGIRGNYAIYMFFFFFRLC